MDNPIMEIVHSKIKPVYLMLIKIKGVKKISIVAAKRILMCKMREICPPS
jgi:hypothetical protein